MYCFREVGPPKILCNIGQSFNKTRVTSRWGIVAFLQDAEVEGLVSWYTNTVFEVIETIGGGEEGRWRFVI